MEEEVQFCLNCKRNVSLANFVIHSAHCERKIQLCERCSEPVPRSELKNHEEEFHSQEPCSDCRISVEKWQLEKHKETCAKRLVPCEYCELELPLDNLSEHIVTCGSRTQQCPKCEKHVMLKDLENHPTRCVKRFFQETGVKKFLSCDYCKLELPTDYFPEHVALCGSLTDQCPKCKNHVMRKDLEKHSINCLSKVLGAISCEYCDLQINFTEYETHIAMCGTRTERCFLCNQHVMVLDRKTHLATCQKEQELRLNLPCEYCKEIFPQECLEAHAALCGSRTQKCERCNKNIELKKLKTHSNVCQEVQQLRLNFPCKHCGDLFPRGCIEAHAAICESRTQKSEKSDGYLDLKKLNIQSNICQQLKTHGECPVCHQSVPWVEMNIHTTVCARMYYETDECERQNQFNEHALKESEASAEGKKQVSSEEGKNQQTKRCSFCFEIFPHLHFSKHLEVCSERPYDCENCLKPFPYRRKEEHMRNCLQLEKRYANDYRLHNEKTDSNKELKKLKKCQFCNVKLPDVLFQHHMDECKHRVEKCTLCAENVPFKDMQEHKLLKCNFQKAINSEAIPEPFNNGERMRYLEENSEICPSCRCKIPIERYNKHLHLCFEGRTECHFCGIQISKNFEHGHFLKCTGILQMVQEDKNPQSKKKTGKKMEEKSLPRTIFENVTSLFSSKLKSSEKSNTLESFSEHRSSHLNRELSCEKGNMTFVQQPPTVYNEVPCEFCNELWPFELLIEHQSGCRPDLVSFPKNDEGSENATATGTSCTPILSASPINAQENDIEWKVQTRRNKPASNRENSDYQLKERSGPSKRHLRDKEKFFYLPPQDSDDLPKKQYGNSNKKRYSQIRTSPEVSKKQNPERKSLEIERKAFSISRVTTEVTNTKSYKDIGASCEVKSDAKKNQFTPFKFSISESNKDIQNDSNSLKENHGASTLTKINDEMKKSNAYSALDSVKPKFDSGNKAVGAERTEKKRMTHSSRDIEANLELVNKDFEENSLLKSISFDENTKRNEPPNIFETAKTCTLNQDMSAIWNLEYKYDNRGKATQLNAVESIGHSALNSNMHDGDYDEKNNETFGRDFVESVKTNQNEDENDTHSNSDDLFYDADDGGEKFVKDDIRYSNGSTKDTSKEKFSSYYSDNLNLNFRPQRESFNENSRVDLNVNIRLEEEEFKNKDSQLEAYLQYLLNDTKQTDEKDCNKIIGNCKCGNEECCCATSAMMKKTSLPKASFKDEAASWNCSEPMDLEPFVSETSTKLKSKKSSFEVSGKKKVDDENFADSEGLKWKKWRPAQVSDSE